jgi:peptide/nickel transport system permease protein
MLEQAELTPVPMLVALHRPTRRGLRRFMRNRSAVFGAAVVGVLICAALLAPFLPMANPDRIALSRRLQPLFSPGYILGSDHLGRNLVSRLVWGARVSLVVGFVAAGLALSVGATLGILAGFYGGKVDNLLMRGIDILMGFPEILLAIAVVAALGPGLINAMMAVALANVPFYARGIRGAVLLLREGDFVEAARSVGANDRRIISRHLIPNIVAPMVVFLSLNIGWMITEMAGLSFIGLGAQPPTADWGTMLADGRAFITVAAHVATVPGLAIFALVLALNLVGEGLREALDPRSQ